MIVRPRQCAQQRDTCFIVAPLMIDPAPSRIPPSGKIPTTRPPESLHRDTQGGAIGSLRAMGMTFKPVKILEEFVYGRDRTCRSNRFCAGKAG